MTSTIEPLLKREEAAELCGVHPCTLDRVRKAGELRAIKRGRLIRYRPSDLRKWLDSWAVGGEA